MSQAAFARAVGRRIAGGRKSVPTSAFIRQPIMLLAIALLTGWARPSAPNSQEKPTPLSLAPGVKIERDIVYRSVGGVDLKLDVYLPPGKAPRPGAVYIHGGGWHGGDKRTGPDILDLPEVVARGYAVAAINYRHAPRYVFPAQIEDVRTAVRFVRAHAGEYGIDPGRIGVWGMSAGGHLASLLALSPAAAWPGDASENRDQSVAVQAVGDLCGPADLTAGDFTTRTSEIIHRVFGGNPDGLRSGSPTTYVTKNAPPFLIVHGDRDETMPLSQSQGFSQKLKAVGAPAELIVVKNATHVFEPSGGVMSPTRPEISRAVADFFDRHLKGKR